MRILSTADQKSTLFQDGSLQDDPHPGDLTWLPKQRSTADEEPKEVKSSPVGYALPSAVEANPRSFPWFSMFFTQAGLRGKKAEDYIFIQGLLYSSKKTTYISAMTVDQMLWSQHLIKCIIIKREQVPSASSLLYTLLGLFK